MEDEEDTLELLPELDEEPEEWKDGEEMLEEAAKESDPHILSEGEKLGMDHRDWVEE